jgi:hypothetical protein
MVFSGQAVTILFPVFSVSSEIARLSVNRHRKPKPRVSIQRKEINDDQLDDHDFLGNHRTTKSNLMNLGVLLNLLKDIRRTHYDHTNSRN